MITKLRVGVIYALTEGHWNYVYKFLGENTYDLIEVSKDRTNKFSLHTDFKINRHFETKDRLLRARIATLSESNRLKASIRAGKVVSAIEIKKGLRKKLNL